MKRVYCIILTILIGFTLTSVNVCAQSISTKKERNLITDGNSLYGEGKYKDALNYYKKAIKENPNSTVGTYNLGLTEIILGSNQADTTDVAKQMLDDGVKLMGRVEKMTK